MRSRRLSFVAGWAVLAVLAIVGFAAFATPDHPVVESPAEAAAASIGHTAGGYAGLAFALGGEDATASVAVAVAPETEQDAAAPEAEGEADEKASVGTVASPSSAWLSEVEVRALVSAYFQPHDVNRAVRIAWCETRFDPNAVDATSGGVGLFNHLPQYWEARAANAGFAGAAATDPAASTAAAAWEVYNGAGWEIFTCR